MLRLGCSLVDVSEIVIVLTVMPEQCGYGLPLEHEQLMRAVGVMLSPTAVQVLPAPHASRHSEPACQSLQASKHSANWGMQRWRSASTSSCGIETQRVNAELRTGRSKDLRRGMCWTQWRPATCCR